MKPKHKITPPSKVIKSKEPSESLWLSRLYKKALGQVSEEFDIDKLKLERGYEHHKGALVHRFNQSNSIDERVGSIKGMAGVSACGGGGLMALAVTTGEPVFTFFGAIYLLTGLMGYFGVKKVKGEKKQLKKTINDEIFTNIHKRLPSYK